MANLYCERYVLREPVRVVSAGGSHFGSDESSSSEEIILGIYYGDLKFNLRCIRFIESHYAIKSVCCLGRCSGSRMGCVMGKVQYLGLWVTE